MTACMKSFTRWVFIRWNYTIYSLNLLLTHLWLQDYGHVKHDLAKTQQNLLLATNKAQNEATEVIDSSCASLEQPESDKENTRLLKFKPQVCLNEFLLPVAHRMLRFPPSKLKPPRWIRILLTLILLMKTEIKSLAFWNSSWHSVPVRCSPKMWKTG